MNATLLTHKPPSGTFPERSWASGSRPNVWVQFDENDAVWIGVFAAGETGFTAVRPFGDDGGRTVLVVAGGQGYIVDVQERALLRKTDWEDTSNAAAVPGADFVVVADGQGIWMERRDGESLTTAAPGSNSMLSDQRQRLATDGIVIQSVTPTSVSGVVWWPDGWHAFDLDLGDRTFVVGAEEIAEPEDNEFGFWPSTPSRREEMQRYLLEWQPQGRVHRTVCAPGLSPGKPDEGGSVKGKNLELPFWLGLLLCAVLLALLVAGPMVLSARGLHWAGFATAVAAIPVWRYIGPPPGPGFLTGLVCVSGLLGLIGLAIVALVRALAS